MPIESNLFLKKICFWVLDKLLRFEKKKGPRFSALNCGVFYFDFWALRQQNQSRFFIWTSFTQSRHATSLTKRATQGVYCSKVPDLTPFPIIIRTNSIKHKRPYFLVIYFSNLVCITYALALNENFLIQLNPSA